MDDFPGQRAGCALVMSHPSRSWEVRWRSFRAVTPSVSTQLRAGWTCFVDGELARRREAWTPRPPRHRAGALAKYARLVGQAPGGAVTHGGAAEWPWFD